MGDGIATHAGKPVFIPKSVSGDRLRVRIIAQTSEFMRGEIIDVLFPGEHRAPAPCPHFAACGGCSLQQLEQTHYRNFKTRIAHNALKQAGYEGADINTVFLPAASRRRAEFKWTGSELAYLGLRSHSKTAIGTCLILQPALQALIAPLAQALSCLPFAKDIASVSLTAADSGIGLTLALIFPYPASVPQAPLQALAEALGIASISVTDGRKLLACAERATLTMRLGAADIALPADAFLQATSEGQQLLTEFAQSASHHSKHIVDLFCGIGTYSFPLSARAKVLAIENDQPMVHALRDAARTRNMPNITAEKRDLFISPLQPHELAAFDTAVINPPRAGAKAQTEQLAAARTPTIVMISCNPGTFARDAKILKNAGYTLNAALAIDQFVWSPHLEIAAAFSR